MNSALGGVHESKHAGGANVLTCARLRLQLSTTTPPRGTETHSTSEHISFPCKQTADESYESPDNAMGIGLTGYRDVTVISDRGVR
jgi:hypothetical protein